jgi:hypothetical protein
MEKYEIYVDLDGTIADFDAHFVALVGKKCTDFGLKPFFR